jgi:hypothetical protein
MTNVFFFQSYLLHPGASPCYKDAYKPNKPSTLPTCITKRMVGMRVEVLVIQELVLVSLQL